MNLIYYTKSLWQPIFVINSTETQRSVYMSHFSFAFLFVAQNQKRDCVQALIQTSAHFMVNIDFSRQTFVLQQRTLKA